MFINDFVLSDTDRKIIHDLYTASIQSGLNLTSKEQLVKMAVGRSDIEALNILLDKLDADPSTTDNWAFRSACGQGKLEIVKILIKHPNTDPNAGDNYAIIKASINGHLEIIKILLSDSRVEIPLSALTLSKHKKHLEIFELLQSVFGLPFKLRIKHLRGEFNPETQEIISKINNFGMFD